MEMYLEELRKFDEIEHIFGREFIDNIQYGEAKDGYLVRIKDYQSLILDKEHDFEKNYEELIAYLIYVKSQIFNRSRHLTKAGTYYRDWSVFRTHYAMTKADFYFNISDLEDTGKIIQYLSELIGQLNYQVVVSQMSISPVNYRDRIYNVFVYLGSVRAIRDLALAYIDKNNLRHEYWSFQLWYLTPTYLTDKYGYIFYLGNEMGSISDCPYNYQAKEYYYSAFYKRVISDINDNKQLTDQQKEEIVHKIRAEMKE